MPDQRGKETPRAPDGAPLSLPATAAETALDGSPLDPAALRQFGAGDGAKTLQLLRFYCKTAQDDLAALHRALSGGRLDVHSLAHRMKGAAQMIGARDVEKAAGALERISRKGPDADFSAPVERVRLAVARVERYLLALEATSVRGGA